MVGDCFAFLAVGIYSSCRAVDMSDIVGIKENIFTMGMPVGPETGIIRGAYPFRDGLRQL